VVRSSHNLTLFIGAGTHTGSTRHFIGQPEIRNLRKGMIIVILISSIFIILGFWFCFEGIKDCLKAYNSRKWDAGTCTILQSKLVAERNDDGIMMFETTVEYQYVYKGKKYTGDKIYFGYDSSKDQEESSILYRSLTGGKRTEVFINPKNPQEAILIPGIKRFTIIPVLVGFVLSYAGLLFLLMK